MITLPAPPDQRECSICRRPFPLTSFRKRYKDPANTERMYECRRCHADKEHQRVVALREKLRQRAFRKELTQLARAEPSHLNEFCAGLMERFGGVEGVMSRLADTYNRAQPGSPARVRAMMATMNVVMAAADAETKRQARFDEDVSRMSDEDLERTLNERLQAMMASDPPVEMEVAENQPIPLDEVTAFSESDAD